MDNTQVVTEVANEESTFNKTKGKNILRILVIICLQISNIAFCSIMGYLLFLLISNTLGLDISPIFNGVINIATLGIGKVTGFLLYFTIVLVAITLVALAYGFVYANHKYCKILKLANNQKMDILLAPLQTTSSMIWMNLINALFSFLSLCLLLDGVYSILSILLYITNAALLIAIIIAIVNIIINRIKFYKLSREERDIVREQCKEFNKRKAKEERRKSVGKLY